MESDKGEHIRVGVKELAFTKYSRNGKMLLKILPFMDNGYKVNTREIRALVKAEAIYHYDNHEDIINYLIDLNMKAKMRSLCD